jgi:hypothetical protein
MSYEDPLTWDRQIRLLAEFDEQHQLKLRTDPESADPGGPFVGVPPLTTRTAFGNVRGLPDNLPLRAPMLRWMYRITDARVNAQIGRQISCFWRSEPVSIESPLRIATTRLDILSRGLRDSGGRKHWIAALRNNLDGATELVSDSWQRKEELAKRAGFDGAGSTMNPPVDMVALCSAWQGLIASISSELLPRDLMALLEVALADAASQGWPARIAAQSMAGLLGDSAWLDRVTLREPNWPRLIGPTSFMRALQQLGKELARAWAPSAYPFVIAHDPWNLSEHRLGYLLASLPVNEDWQQRILGLRKDRAASQARALSLTMLQASRELCLRLRLRAPAIKSADALRSAFAEQTNSIFGFEFPNEFAGYLPRICDDDAQRLLGLWHGLSDHARLIQSYDVDWYRNPRAIQDLLGQFSELAAPDSTEDLARDCLPLAMNWLTCKLDG